MAKKVYIDFELRYKEAVANLDEMQKEYSKLEKQVDKTTESQEELILVSCISDLPANFQDVML